MIIKDYCFFCYILKKKYLFVPVQVLTEEWFKVVVHILYVYCKLLAIVIISWV